MGEIETIAFHIYQKVLSFQSAVSNLDINKCSRLIRGCGLGVEACGRIQTSSEGVLNWWSNTAGVNSCCMRASERAWVFAYACEQWWELSKQREELKRPHSGQSLSKWPWGQNWTTVHTSCKTDMKGWNHTHRPLSPPHSPSFNKHAHKTHLHMFKYTNWWTQMRQNCPSTNTFCGLFKCAHHNKRK